MKFKRSLSYTIKGTSVQRWKLWHKGYGICLMHRGEEKAYFRMHISIFRRTQRFQVSVRNWCLILTHFQQTKGADNAYASTK